MAEKVEDLNLPASSINRIVREALPDGVSVSKETKTAIARAASIFILYATTCANNFAIKSKRKTITVTDIFQALQDMELEEFIPELKECLEAHKQDQKEKKEAAADRKRKQVAAASTSAASDITDMATDNALLNTTDGEGEGGGGEGGGGGGGGDDVCLVTDEQMEVENGSAAEPLSVS